MTVTVCPVFQFAGVKVRLDTLTVPSVVSLLTTGTVTFARGCRVSATVKVMLARFSLVVVPLCAVIARSGGTSLSVIVAV